MQTPVDEHFSSFVDILSFQIGLVVMEKLKKLKIRGGAAKHFSASAIHDFEGKLPRMIWRVLKFNSL